MDKAKHMHVPRTLFVMISLIQGDLQTITVTICPVNTNFMVKVHASGPAVGISQFIVLRSLHLFGNGEPNTRPLESVVVSCPCDCVRWSSESPNWHKRLSSWTCPYRYLPQSDALQHPACSLLFTAAFELQIAVYVRLIWAQCSSKLTAGMSATRWHFLSANINQSASLVTNVDMSTVSYAQARRTHR